VRLASLLVFVVVFFFAFDVLFLGVGAERFVGAERDGVRFAGGAVRDGALRFDGGAVREGVLRERDGDDGGGATRWVLAPWLFLNCWRDGVVRERGVGVRWPGVRSGRPVRRGTFMPGRSS